MSIERPDSDRIYRAMIQATVGSMKLVQSRKACDLLIALKRCKLGTAEVENSICKTCRMLSANGQMTVKMKIMRKKISNAFICLNNLKIQNARTWKEYKKMIPAEVRVGYLNRWRTYLKKFKQNLVVKNQKKVEWLKKKWRKSGNTRNNVGGGRIIDVKDASLTAEFSSEPRLYGGVMLTPNEHKVMCLPPKFGIYQKIDVTQCKIDIEEAVNKLRWTKAQEDRAKRDNNRRRVDNGDNKPVFVDTVSKKVNIKKLVPSDLPFNPQVGMPPSMELEDEIKILQMKTEIVKIAKDMAESSVKWSNLDNDERQGLDSLKTRVNNHEIVCTVTDKSGRWSCDTISNYKEGCVKLVSDEDKTPIITMEEHQEAERIMNSCALALTRMLGLESGSIGDKIRNAVTAEGCNIAPLYGLRKDHKVIGDSADELKKGPKLRPVCGARDSLTKRTSFILCKIISPLINGNNTHCSSTDDLIKEFGRVNQRYVDKEWVVGSLDVDSLYPSLDVGRCADVVKRRLERSEMVFENLDWKEIALFLIYQMTPNQVVSCVFKEYLPHRRYRKRPPLFVRSGSMNNRKIRHQPWIFPRRVPDEGSLRKMFCEAVSIMIKKTIGLHDYRLDGNIHRQSRGGSIGSDLTGVVSDIYMCDWDENLMSLISSNSITVKMYKRYKDDVNLIMDVSDVVAPGTAKGDRDKTTMEKVKDLAETIDECLKVTTDVDSDHADGRLPVLDVRVWIGDNVAGETKILYSHYMKEVSTRALIGFRSSHSKSMKKSVMVNEVMRIFRNCSKDVPWDEIDHHVSYFVKRMQFSGYPAEFREGVVSEAFRKYDVVNRSADITPDTQVLNQQQQQQQQHQQHQQQQNMGQDKHKWYSKGGIFDSVLFVEATPGSEFLRKVQGVMRRLKMKIKVVERVGATIKRILQRSNPFEKRPCGRDKCMLCDQEGENGDCRARGCIYEFICEECQRMYRGQTGRSAYERTKEQVEAWERGDDECPLQRHANVYHGGGDFRVRVKVIAKCYGKPSRRLITEAVMIEEVPDTMAMNNKSEWSYVKLTKVQLPIQS